MDIGCFLIKYKLLSKYGVWNHISDFVLRFNLSSFLQVLWIRIHLDPHSFGYLGSGSVLGMRIRIWIQEHGNWPKSTNKPGFLLFKKLLYLRRYVFLHFTYFKYIFHVKFNILWLKSLIRIRIRIRQDPHWFGFLDTDPYPDPHWDTRLDLDPD